MTITLKVRYHDGKLEPLEPLDLEEGSELILTVTGPEPPVPAQNPGSVTAGTGKALPDGQPCEKPDTTLPETNAGRVDIPSPDYRPRT